MSELLAKSGDRAPTLLEHTQHVIDAAEALFGGSTPTRLGECWLRFFNVEPDRWPMFYCTLRAAAAFHDLGKANDGFQKAVKRLGEQAIRHEHLSGLIMFHRPVWAWLQQIQGIDWDIALSAVLSHHLKLKAADKSLAGPLQRGGNWHVRLPAHDEPSFKLLLELIVKGSWPSIPVVWSFDDDAACESIEKARRKLLSHLEDLHDSLDEDSPRTRFLRAARAALIAADAAASGLVREEHSIREWIEERFDVRDARDLCDGKYILNEIINPRTKHLGARWEDWHSFQLGAGNQPKRTLMLAPCGSGKTLAAWKWIEQQATLRAVKRVIFLYPTRATATEGFRDYVSWAPEGSLLHGTARFDLDDMFRNPPDFSSAKDVRSERDYTAEARLFAIGFWDKRVFSATVDQFLGFLQYAYSAVCLLPVLADSVIVVDEVHSFDDAMFSALKEFLKEFNVPTLCMTATLPKARRDQLQRQCGLTVYDDKPEDLRDVAYAPRYRVHRLSDKEAAMGHVCQGLIERKRILWVVNTVARAQELTEQMRQVAGKIGGQVLCYHSRFTLNHRKKWHENVVRAFQAASGEESKAVVAITTQVCEMSLDLDADILVTENAPITALIQRMGRCNRKTKLPLLSLGEVYVYNPSDERPYEPEDLRAVPSFLNELVALGTVSQSALETALAKHGKVAPKGDRVVSFTESGPFADGAAEDFRDLDERTTPGILDLDAYLRTEKKMRPGLEVPVPRKLKAPPCNHPDAKYLVRAPAENYDESLGLCDQPINRTGV